MGPRRPVRPAALVAAGSLLFAAGLGSGALLARSGEGGGAPPSSSTSTTDPSTDPTAEPTTDPGADVSASAEPVGVPDACVAAGEGAQEALEALDAAAGAVADLDAVRLDAVVDALQPLRQRLPGDVAACRAAAPGP